MPADYWTLGLDNAEAGLPERERERDREEERGRERERERE
jgi:hypothetical protein